MKGNGKTWNEIAQVVKRSKDEVRERFKELNSDSEGGDKGDGEKEKEKDGKDESKSGGGGKGGDGGGGGWTSDQDEKILSMKASGKSWKDIVLEVGASKKDVQARHKELENAAKSGDGNNGDGNGDGIGSGGGGSGWGGGIQAAGGLDDGGMDFSGLFTDEAWGNTGGSGWNDRPAASQSPSQNEKNDTNSNNRNKSKSQNQKQQNNSPNGDSGNKGFDNDGFDSQEEYGGEGRLKVDDIWSKHDVEVLEMLEQRYTEHKWLHIQAGFYNWTGRMVVAEMIERKFRDDGAV